MQYENVDINILFIDCTFNLVCMVCPVSMLVDLLIFTASSISC